MEARFLGGVAEIGRLGMLLEKDGARLLFDYGIAPADPPLYPMDCPPVDMVFLSHAHLDHSGMLPWLARRHAAPIVATPPTASIGELLIQDSLKVAREEAYALPWDKHDARAVLDVMSLSAYHEQHDVGGVEVKLHSAGHIPGSTMFEVRGSSVTLFTGDLNLTNTELVWGAHPVRCDTLVVEATYAGREHPPRAEVAQAFVRKIEEVNDRGGIAVVPAFAVGRTQEALLILQGKGFDVYLDGMGKTVTKLMLAAPEYLRSAAKLRRAWNEARVVHSPHGRHSALSHADVIVTTSGMLEGGPVLHYIHALRNDPRSAILMTGFQAPGTGGRKLLESRTLTINGVVEQVQMEVCKFDLSAHAGHKELVEFIRACGPKNVILFHSVDREPLARALQGEFNFILPETGQPVEIR